MRSQINFYNDLIFKKLKKYKLRKINLEKEEFSKFINFLINNS